jgi:hypothetical protein
MMAGRTAAGQIAWRGRSKNRQSGAGARKIHAPGAAILKA